MPRSDSANASGALSRTQPADIQPVGSFPVLSITGLIVLLAGCGGSAGGGSALDASAPTNGESKTSTATTSPTSPVQPVDKKTEISVLGLFTGGVDARFSDVDLRINHLVNVANDVFADNGAEIRLTLTYLGQVDYDDAADAPTALNDLTFEAVPSLEGIADLRNQYQADLVVLFKEYANDGYCGFAWVGGFQKEGDFSDPAEADFAYSVVAANCSDYVLVHEIGHNLGLAHSWRETEDGGTFSYSRGYGVDNDFATVMANPSEFNAVQLPRISSPELTCNAQPCGIVYTEDQAADALRTLLITKEQVAEYR